MAHDRLEPLRQRFRERCAEDLSVLKQARGRPNGLAEDEVKSRIHRLSGLAGGLGFSELSQLAGVLDDQIAAQQPTVAGDIDRLEAELARVASSGGAS